MQIKLANFLEKKFNTLSQKSCKQLKLRFKEEILIDTANEVLRGYKSKSNVIGIVLPALLTFLPLVLPQKSEKEWILIFLKYYPVAIFVFFILGLIYFGSQAKIWSNVCTILMNEELEKTSKENKKLNKAIIDSKKKQKQLTKIHSLLALICQKVKEGHNGPDLCEIVALDILNSLGESGKYSVAIYESYMHCFWMPCFKTNMESYNTPALYEEGVTNITSNKFKEYCYYKCLHGKEKKMTKLLKSRTEIKEEFVFASDDYCQYACCSLQINKSHKILLEMVSYYDDTFTKEDNYNDFFKDLFEQYIPVLNIIFSISASEELCNAIAN